MLWAAWGGVLGCASVRLGEVEWSHRLAFEGGLLRREHLKQM